jgi:hypothetical protein
MKTVPVTMRALIQRINRKLAADTDEKKRVGSTISHWLGKRLRKSRGAGEFNNLGDFYVLNLSMKEVVDSHVNPEKLGRKLGVLADWESIADE